MLFFYVVPKEQFLCVTKLKLDYLALILVFLRRSADDINLCGAQAEHVVNRDVLHGAISRVDLNVTLVREGIISQRCVWHFDAAQPKATTQDRD